MLVEHCYERCLKLCHVNCNVLQLYLLRNSVNNILLLSEGCKGTVELLII